MEDNFIPDMYELIAASTRIEVIKLSDAYREESSRVTTILNAADNLFDLSILQFPGDQYLEDRFVFFTPEKLPLDLRNRYIGNVKELAAACMFYSYYYRCSKALDRIYDDFVAKKCPTERFLYQGRVVLGIWRLIEDSYNDQVKQNDGFIRIAIPDKYRLISLYDNEKYDSDVLSKFLNMPVDDITSYRLRREHTSRTSDDIEKSGMRQIERDPEQPYTTINPIKRIGIQIRNARIAKNLSQWELARLLQTTISYISAIERGHFKASFPKLEKLSELLNIPLGDLVSVDPSREEKKPGGERNIVSDIAKVLGITPEKLTEDLTMNIGSVLTDLLPTIQKIADDSHLSRNEVIIQIMKVLGWKFRANNQ